MWEELILRGLLRFTTVFLPGETLAKPFPVCVAHSRSVCVDLVACSRSSISRSPRDLNPRSRLDRLRSLKLSLSGR